MQSLLARLCAYYTPNIESATRANTDYRRVLNTTQQMQLVLMSLRPGEQIGTEVHPDTTQFFRVEQGSGVAFVDSARFELRDGSVLIVPAGATHNVVNTSSADDLKLYTIYSPPHHPPGTVQRVKPSE